MSDRYIVAEDLVAPDVRNRELALTCARELFRDFAGLLDGLPDTHLLRAEVAITIADRILAKRPPYVINRGELINVILARLVTSGAATD